MPFAETWMHLEITILGEIKLDRERQIFYDIAYVLVCSVMFNFMGPHDKAHLTLHSRTSGSRWVITPSWLSELLRSFLYSSSLYSCHFILISSASGKHCKNKIQKCTNFFCNSFFLIGSNNLKNNYKVLLLVSFQNKFEKTPLSEKNPLKWSTMCF